MVVIRHIDKTMKRLLIVGAGGFGREILNWVSDVPENNIDWKIGGFLDANSAALNGYNCGYSILDDPSNYIPKEEDRFICAIGHPSTKLRICRSLTERGSQFITLIHPTAIIGNNCIVGVGSVFCPGAVVTSDVKIGEFVMMNLQSTVGHDAFIADGCTLSPHADVNGFASLGEGVFLGSHAVVLPGAKVGDYAIVGAGSVVLKKVKAGATVMGVPAKQIAGF